MNTKIPTEYYSSGAIFKDEIAPLRKEGKPELSPLRRASLIWTVRRLEDILHFRWMECRCWA